MKLKAPIEVIDPSPVRRVLARRGLSHRVDQTLFYWQHLYNAVPPVANSHAWIHGGTQQLAPSVLSTDDIGTMQFDPRVNRIVTAPQNRLGFGAPQYPAITNLCADSVPVNATWSGSNVTYAADAVAAPFGSGNASKIVEDALTNDFYYAQDAVSVTTGNNYLFGTIVKGAERTFIRMEYSSTPRWDTDAGQVTFNLTTGEATVVGTPTDYDSLYLGDGWWYCWIIHACVSSGSSGPRIRLMEDVSTVQYDGDGTSGVYCAHVHFGVLDYFAPIVIPTLNAADTRAADALRWINAGVFNKAAAQGALFWCGKPSHQNSAQRTHVALNNNDGVDDAVWQYVTSGNNLNTLVFGSANATAVGPTNAQTLTSQTRLTTWDANYLKWFVNGAKIGETPMDTAPANLDRLEVGGANSSDARDGAEHYNIAVFDFALPDAEAIALTRNPEDFKWLA